MLGSILGGALGIGSSIFGAVSASKAMRKAKANVERQRQDNQNWYDRRYNEDGTQRADAQRVLTKLNDSIRERNRAAAGTQAVTGGTEEAAAATKAANAQAMAEAASQIATASEARKDRIEQQYQQRDDNYNQQLNDIEVKRAQSVADATKSAGEAASKIASMF